MPFAPSSLWTCWMLDNPSFPELLSFFPEHLEGLSEVSEDRLHRTSQLPLQKGNL